MHRVRRVEDLVRPKNGQVDLNFARDESLSMLAKGRGKGSGNGDSNGFLLWGASG